MVLSFTKRIIPASVNVTPFPSQIAGAERIRVWRLYLRAARNGFRTGFTSIYQVRAVKA